MKITKLDQVVDYQLCCGCGLCAYLHPDDIQMVDDPTFGRRPKFITNIENSESFRIATQLCPGLGLSHCKDETQTDVPLNHLARDWGPVIEIFEGYAVDPEIRHLASSGGAITAISLYCIEQEGMHGVLHTTADNEKPYLNDTSMSSSRDAVLSASGSRYSPASPCEKLALIEKAPSPCVFVGKPCDVAATRNAMRCRPVLNSKIGLSISCICAGTPSTNGTIAMLRHMGFDSPDKLTTLRYRGHGWPGKTTAEIHSPQGIKRRELTYEQSWGNILQKFRQWRCYICPDHTGEFSDISVGDPWYKKNDNDEKGKSLILVRTERGKRIINNAIKKGYLIAEKREPHILPLSQPNLLKTRSMLWGRLLTLKISGAPFPSYIGFDLYRSWKNNISIKEKITTVFGTFKRVHKKKLKKAINNT